MKVKIISAILVVSFFTAGAQVNKDKAVFKEYKPGYYQNSILKDVREVEEQKQAKPLYKRFKMDLSGATLPNKLDKYKSEWRNNPVSQGNTNTCWCFSTTSFYETEVYRLTGKKVRLSEMYTVYWEYVEKAKYFVETRGESAFEEGSEGNAVTRMYKKYGIVPLSDYSGLKDGRKFHSHEAMKNEMDAYMHWVKTNNAWNEEAVVATIRSIMKHYIGEPPTEITVDGKKMTPLQYLNDYLKLNPDDYVDVLSYMQEPYYKQVVYDVPDNWWHSADYYNVPLDDFMKILNSAIEKGYTLSIGGDVSEAGFDTETQCALVPSFDIPAANIDEYSRQFRFSNQTTTDDHGMHLVGYTDFNGKRWYLIKDSSSGSRNNDPNAAEFGSYFFSEDYVKLKMMDFCIHKDALKDYMKKFK